MMNLLSPHDLTKLAEELTMPLVIRHVLDSGWNNEDQMLIASLLNDMRKDQLLLSIAFTLKLIAEQKADEPDIAHSLTYHADFVLEDYAPHWRAHKNSVFPAEWVAHLEEDLEHMHEILLLTRDAFAYRDDTIYNLCETIAEYIQDKINDDTNASMVTTENLSLDLDNLLSSNAPNNVIAFPMHRIRGQ